VQHLSLRPPATNATTLEDLVNFYDQRFSWLHGQREGGLGCLLEGALCEIPVRHDLDAWLRQYLDGAGVMGQDDKMPFFRAADGKRRQLTPAGYRAHSMTWYLFFSSKETGAMGRFSADPVRSIL